MPANNKNSVEPSVVPLCYSTKDVQKLFGGISRSSIYKMIKKKTIAPLSLFRRNYLFSKEDIDKLIATKRK